jgi:hypothetical protein
MDWKFQAKYLFGFRAMQNTAQHCTAVHCTALHCVDQNATAGQASIFLGFFSSYFFAF